MAILKLPAKGATYQPYGAFKLTPYWAKKNIAHLAVGGYDIINNTKIEQSGIVNDVTRAGKGFKAAATSSAGFQLADKFLKNTSGTGNYSLVFYSNPIASTPLSFPICVLDGIDDEIYALINGSSAFGNSSGQFTAWWNDNNPSANTLTLSTSTSAVDGTFKLYSITRRDGNHIAQAGTELVSAAGNSVDYATANHHIRVAGFSSSGYGYTEGSLPLVIVFNEALSDAELLALNNNPWQIFEVPQKLLYLPSAVAHATSGALSGQGSILSGSATRFRAYPTSGILTAQGSVIAGSARHNIPHPTTGALTGQGASIIGSADRQPPGSVTHATTGALTGQNSLIAGTAARLRAFSSSGVLTGQSAIIAGSAAHNVPHPTSGTLSGQGAIIAGTSARVGAPVTHATSGVLTAQGSLIVGSATRSGASVLTPQDLLNIADAVWAHSSAVHCQTLLTEVWGRLGLDIAAPLISGTTQISFGAIVMAMTELAGTVTVTRQ